MCCGFAAMLSDVRCACVYMHVQKVRAQLARMKVKAIKTIKTIKTIKERMFPHGNEARSKSVTFGGVSFGFGGVGERGGDCSPMPF